MSIRFELEIDGIKSIIDSTLPKNKIKSLILSEIEQMFEGNIEVFGEDRFVEGPGKWHFKGRYLT